jgi:lamin tail-like protein
MASKVLGFCWRAAWSLVLVGMARGAFAQEAEWAEELRGEAAGLTARLEFGNGGARVGFRVGVSGGEPYGAALLVARVQGEDGRAGSAHRELVRLDAFGCGGVTVRDFEGHEAIEARFVARTPAGLASSNAVLVPSQGQIHSVVAQRGDVVVTEIMKDPAFVSDSVGEWFELVNLTNHVVNIAGWKISDAGSNAHTIKNGTTLILLAPGQFFVLGVNSDPLVNGGIPVDYKYSNFTLGNGSDQIYLTARNGMLVDEVVYDDGIFWPDTSGVALNLHLLATDAYLNDDPANWCDAKTPISSANTDLGTPGAPNDTCP